MCVVWEEFNLICSHHKLSPAAGDVTCGGGLLHPQGCTAQETRGRRLFTLHSFPLHHIHAVRTVISDTPALVCGRIQPGIHQHYEHHIEIFSFVSAERGCLTLIRYVILLHKQVMK